MMGKLNSRFCASATAALAVAAAAALAGTAAAQTKTYSLGTNPQGSTGYSTAAAVAKAAATDDIRLRVIPQGGTRVTLPLLNQGKLDYAIGVSVTAALAYGGKAMFKGKPQKNVRVAVVLRKLYAGLFTRKDTDIKTLADLKGKRMPSGFKQQRNLGIFQDTMLAMGGLSMKDLNGVPAPNGIRGVDDLLTGKVDAAVFAMTAGKTRQVNASVGIRYLSLPNTPEAIATMNRMLPGVIVETVTPGPKFPGVTGPTNALIAPYIMVVGAHVPDDAVYALMKTLHGEKKTLVSAFKVMEDFDPQQMMIDFGVPYHPGALRFYKESGQVK